MGLLDCQDSDCFRLEEVVNLLPFWGDCTAPCALHVEGCDFECPSHRLVGEFGLCWPRDVSLPIATFSLVARVIVSCTLSPMLGMPRSTVGTRYIWLWWAVIEGDLSLCLYCI